MTLLNWLVDGSGIRDYDSTRLYSLEELVDKFEPRLCFAERRDLCVIDLERLLVLDRFYHCKNKFTGNFVSDK